MVADNLLIAGALFILSLAIGQMLVKRRQTSNKALTCLFAITFLWVTNAIGYRYGLLDRMPHLNRCICRCCVLPAHCGTPTSVVCTMRTVKESTTRSTC